MASARRSFSSGLITPQPVLCYTIHQGSRSVRFVGVQVPENSLLTVVQISLDAPLPPPARFQTYPDLSSSPQALDTSKEIPRGRCTCMTHLSFSLLVSSFSIAVFLVFCCVKISRGSLLVFRVGSSIRGILILCSFPFFLSYPPLSNNLPRGEPHQNNDVLCWTCMQFLLICLPPPVRYVWVPYLPAREYVSFWPQNIVW